MTEALATIRTALAAHCRASAHCLDCECVQELNLEALAERYAGTPLAELPLQYRCGSRTLRVIVSGRFPSGF